MTEAKPTNTTSLTLKLELVPGSDTALLRVIAVLHRRCCRVTRADFMATAAADRLELALEAPPAHAHRVPAWLRGLVDVTRVEAEQPEPFLV